MLLTALLFIAAGRVAQAQTAQVQFIHASADPAVLFVDLYIDDTLAIDDLRLNTSNPYLEVPAGAPVNIGVAPQASAGVQDTLVNFPRTFEADGLYTAALIGLLEPGTFAPNPDGRSTELSLVVEDGARLANEDGSVIEYRVLNAITDMPSLTLTSRDGETVFVDSLAYGELSGWQSVVPVSNYVLDLGPTNFPAYVLASFTRDFFGFQDQPVTLILTGFEDKFANQLGPAPRINGVFSDGVVPDRFEVAPIESSDATARIQLLHGSPDPAAEVVDIYVNDGLLVDDMAYGSGTGFLTLRTAEAQTLSVAPSGSASAADALQTFDLALNPGARYTGAVIGVTDPAAFPVSPDGQEVGLTLALAEGALEQVLEANMTTLNVVYAVPDAPQADILIGNAVAAEAAGFGTVSSYVSVESLPAQEVTLRAADGTPVAEVGLDLSNVGDRAVTVLATGFLTGTDVPPFTTLMFYNDGFKPDVVRPVANESEAGNVPDAFVLRGNYPNPFNPVTTVVFDLPEQARVHLDVFNVSGQRVMQLPEQLVGAGTAHTLSVDATDLPSGVYLYRVVAETRTNTLTQTGRMTVLK